MKVWRKKNRIARMVAIGLPLWGGMCFGAWTYDPSAKTLTTGEGDTLIRIVNVSKDKTENNLTIGQNYNNANTVIPENAVIDFTEAITDSNGVAYNLVALGNHSLRGFGMSKVILPESELQIAQQSFRACKKLEDIVIPNLNSTSIPAGLFRETSEIKSIVIRASENCTEINGSTDARTFADCTNCTNIVIDAPALTSSGFVADNNRIFYRCNALVNLSILSRNAIELAPIATGNAALTALRSITFSGPVCAKETMDVLIGFFPSEQRPNCQIRVSMRQDGWRALATPLSELTEEEKSAAPQDAFGRFYTQNESSWVWAVNEPSKYDIDDGVGIVTIEGALGAAVGAPTPDYQESTEMAMGETISLSAPDWQNPATSYRYVCESIAIYIWNSAERNWGEPTIIEGNTHDYTVVEGQQKIRFNYVLDKIPAFEVTTQGNDSCTVAFNPAPVDGYIKPGTVTLTATSSDSVPFGRWIGVGLTEEQTRNPVLTVDAASVSSIMAVFDTPWVYDAENKKITDGLWHFPVTVQGNKLTVEKRYTDLTGHVLDFSKPVEPEGYMITAIGDAFAKDASIVVAKEVILPTTLETIGREAFYQRSDITNFVLNCPSLKTIGVSAFRECSGNRSDASKWDLSSVTSMGNDAFRAFGMRSELTMPSTLTSIGTGTFRQIATLSRAEFSLQVDTIPDLLFYYTDATNLTFHSSASAMTYRVFEGAKSFNIVLDMPNLEVWGCQTPAMSHLTNIEYRTSKQLTMMQQPANKTTTFAAANLKTALFAGPLPTAEFMKYLLSWPKDYQVTLIASKRQVGWLTDSRVRDCTDEEFAEYLKLWPDETKRPKIYTSDDSKRAFIRWQKSEFDSVGLMIFVR